MANDNGAAAMGTDTSLRRDELLGYLRRAQDRRLDFDRRSGAKEWVLISALAVMAWKATETFSETTASKLLAFGPMAALLLQYVIGVMAVIQARSRPPLRVISSIPTSGDLLVGVWCVLVPATTHIAVSGINFASLFPFLILLVCAPLPITEVLDRKRRRYPRSHRITWRKPRPFSHAAFVVLVVAAVVSAFHHLMRWPAWSNTAATQGLLLVAGMHWTIGRLLSKNGRQTTAVLDEIERDLILFQGTADEAIQRLELHFLGPGLEDVIRSGIEDIDASVREFETHTNAAISTVKEILQIDARYEAELAARTSRCCEPAMKAMDDATQKLGELIEYMTSLSEAAPKDEVRQILTLQTEACDRKLRQVRATKDRLAQEFIQPLKDHTDNPHS